MSNHVIINENIKNEKSNFMDSIGKKSQSKDRNATWQTITTALVNRSTIKKKMIGNVGGYLNIHPRNFWRSVKRRKSIKIDPINQCCGFSGRFRRSNTKWTNEIKCIIEKYWHDHTRLSPNIKDVLKQRIYGRLIIFDA